MSNSAARPPQSVHVLVVEDEAIIRETLCMYLEHLGVGHISTAPNGRKALRQLAQSSQRPDLILLDVYMPEMDGIEFLEALQSVGYAGAIALVSGVNIEILDLTARMARDWGFRLVGAAEKPISLQAVERFLARIEENPNPPAEA